MYDNVDDDDDDDNVVVVDDDDDDVVVVVVEECSIKYVRKWKTRCKGVASGI
jgi:hypothetical protein